MLQAEGSDDCDGEDGGATAAGTLGGRAAPRPSHSGKTVSLDVVKVSKMLGEKSGRGRRRSGGGDCGRAAPRPSYSGKTVSDSHPALLLSKIQVPPA